MPQRYSGAMATIQIRNVPEQVHRVYQARAALAGQSLQEYLLAELIRHATLASPQEIMAEVERDPAVAAPGSVTADQVAEAVRRDRQGH